MMNSYQASWEDEENNRQILFHVEYVVAEPSVRITSITPVQVSIFCPQTKHATRTLGVHTERARAMLVRQFLERGQLAILEQELSLITSIAAVA